MSEGKVLIVEPEPIAVELMQRRLRAAGFEVAWAGTAADALRLAEADPPDVILLAAALPDADGFHALVRLRALSELRGVSIAFVAAFHRDPGSVGRALELGADDCLRKPIDAAELVARVRSLSRLRRQIAELTRKSERLAELNAELERVAITDPLTGLHNRRHLEQRLTEELVRWHRYGHALSVVVGDVDFFKKVNDGHGHLAGDEVLRVVGATIQRTVRRADFAARYGGEEFVIVTPATDLAAARIAAERVRTTIADQRVAVPSAVGQITLEVTMSFGVASATAGIETPAALIAAADGALYRAKANGRNRVELAGNPESLSRSA